MKKWLFYLLIVVVILVPVLIFVGHFKCHYNQELSHKSEDWYYFAAYIGGIVGTIASIGSVWLLYITLNRQIIQQFESTFFNLLLVQRDIVKYLEGNVEDDTRVFITYEGVAYINARANKIVIEPDSNYNIIEDNTLSSYFENLKEILRYIDETNCDIKQDKKQEYANFVKAQMSKNERDLLKKYLEQIQNSENKQDENFKQLITIYKLNE